MERKYNFDPRKSFAGVPTRGKFKRTTWEGVEEKAVKPSVLQVNNPRGMDFQVKQMATEEGEEEGRTYYPLETPYDNKFTTRSTRRGFYGHGK